MTDLTILMTLAVLVVAMVAAKSGVLMHCVISMLSLELEVVAVVKTTTQA